MLNKLSNNKTPPKFSLKQVTFFLQSLAHKNKVDSFKSRSRTVASSLPHAQLESPPPRFTLMDPSTSVTTKPGIYVGSVKIPLDDQNPPLLVPLH